MTWPFSPLTTYVATTTPSIKAVDLNDFQSATNDAYNAARFRPVSTYGGDGSQLWFGDSANNKRRLVDHLGFLAGRAGSFVEPWLAGSIAANQSGVVLTSNPSWSATTGNGVTGGVRAATGFAGSRFAFVSTLGNQGALSTTNQAFLMDATSGVAVFEFTTIIDSASVSHALCKFGLSIAGNGLLTAAPSSTYQEAVVYLDTNASPDWFVGCTDGSVTRNSASTGIAASTAPIRWRIEMTGSGSPAGAIVRWFANGSLVNTSSFTHYPHLTSQSFYPVMASFPYTTGSQTIEWGGLRLYWAEQLSSDDV